MQFGVEGELRMLSGAALNVDEIKNAADMFMPSPFDSYDTILFKANQLQQFLTMTIKNVDPSNKYGGKIPKDVLFMKVADIAAGGDGTSDSLGIDTGDEAVDDFIKRHGGGK